MTQPLVSVIIPNYNGVGLLPACLASLRAQSFRDFEVIVVDDASTDGSLALLAGYPEVRVLRHARNRRFAVSVNDGIAAAQGELIALFNSDVAAEPGWLAALLTAAAAYPTVGLFASHIRLWPSEVAEPLDYYAAQPQAARLHTTGDYYSWSGVPNSRGVWQVDRGQFAAGPVFGPCAAAALYRRSLLDLLAQDNADGRPFDERLVMYCEDVDLNIRAILHGATARYVPEAVIYHKLSASGGGALASYFVGRNLIALAAKHWSGTMWADHWGRFVGATLRESFRALRHLREPAARARLRGQLAAIAVLPAWLRARPCPFPDQQRLTQAIAQFGEGMRDGLDICQSRRPVLYYEGQKWLG